VSRRHSLAENNRPTPRNDKVGRNKQGNFIARPSLSCSNTALAEQTTGSNTLPIDSTDLLATMQHKSGTAIIWRDNTLSLWNPPFGVVVMNIATSALVLLCKRGACSFSLSRLVCVLSQKESSVPCTPASLSFSVEAPHILHAFMSSCLARLPLISFCAPDLCPQLIQL